VARSPIRRVAAWCVAAALAVAAVALAGPVAVAEGPAGLQITKSASTDDIVPGEEFTYTIQVTCIYSSAIPASGCTNASIADTIPDGLHLTGPPTVVSAGNSFTVTGDAGGSDASVSFTTPLDDPAGGQGMLQGTTATITIPVVADALTYDDNGVPIINEATFDADNPDTDAVSDTASVTPSVPLVIDSDVSKSFTPTHDVAAPGTITTIDITGQQTSETGVDEWVITDPIDPTASPNPFDYLAFEGITIGAFPANADQVQIDVYTPGGWVSGTPGPTASIPGSVDPDDVRGIRITFTSSTGELIEIDETVDISIETSQRDVGDLPANLTVDNTVSSTVERDGETATSTGDAEYVIEANLPEVTADKSFDQESVLHGDSVDATLVGGVAGDLAVEELSILEPSPGTFSDAMTFEGFPSAPVWPDGADTASVTYFCEGGGSETVAFAEGAIPDPPSGGCTVSQFQMDFTGLMDPGESATIEMTVGTDPDDPALMTEIDNEMTVTGTTPGGATDQATGGDNFWAYLDVLAPVADKSIVPSTILGEDGEWTILELSGGIAGRPDPGVLPDGNSTGDANTIVVQDPSDPTATPQPFWDAFNPDRLTSIVIPPGSELTVNYWDGDSWETLTGPIDDSQSPWSYDITGNAPPSPDDIGGLQFVFTNPDGFPPGTVVNPNVVMEFDGSADVDLPFTFENCVGSESTNATGADSGPAEACDTIDVIDPENPTGPGVGDLIDKNWLGGEPPQLIERSQDRATARLLWSTGGYSNVDAMTITDTPGAPGNLTESVFDAFDLVRVQEITPVTDPYIEYDAVQSVEIYRTGSGAWVTPSADPCATASDCYGQFPGFALNAGERADTVAVRLVFVENPDRVLSTDPEAPPVGAGVARSIGNDRPIDLVFELRDTLRSDPSTAVTADLIYNDDVFGGAPGDEGLVWNQVNATADFTDRDDISDNAEDPILILDATYGVSVTKDWTDNEVGIPPVGTDPDEYPSAPIRLTATNESAPAYVDVMSVCDGEGCPTTGGPFTTFEYFDFEGFTEITAPAGATGVTITLVESGGATFLTTTDVATALAWDAGDGLDQVTGFTIEWTGRIEPGATAVVAFQNQLRTTLRSSGDLINADDEGTIVLNAATATVDDAGNDGDPVTDQAEDTASLEEFVIGLSVDKTFGPTVGDQSDTFTQVEPDQSPFIMMLRSQPSEGARPAEVVVTDYDPSFWNVYEFVGIDPSFVLEAPVNQVQMTVLSGATTTTGTGGELEYVGGTETDGPVGTVPVAPDPPAAEDIQGIQFTFNRSDGDQWEGPIHPIQEIPIIVQRRDTTLIEGTPPPTDEVGNSPTAGEDQAGHTVNTVEGQITSFLDNILGNPLVVDAVPDDAEVIFEHAFTAVEVDKQPTGTVSPGAVIPYTLTFTNTGDTPIIGPTFTDTLPFDAEGSLLQLDPNAAETGTSPYSFVLSGPDPDPADGLPLPTDPAEIAITENLGTEPPTIVFDFPDTFALAVGQTYTITIDMVTRPALAANTVIENEASVVGDRPFDQCNDDPFDPAVDECSDSTNVTVAAGGAIRTVKQVKADDDSLGSTSAVPGATCVPDAEGFYSAPCIPISPPGTTVTWRLVIQNTGNVPLDQLTVIDRMPDLGDSTVIENFDRDSAWWAEILDPLADFDGPFAGAPDVFGTTNPVPCDDEIAIGGGTCPAGEWLPIADFGGDYSDVTGLKYVYDFVDFLPLQPGDTIVIDVQTRTPVSSPTAGADTIAWNTVAAGAVESTTGGGDGDRILPTEGNEIGVALATGPLSVVKTVSGEAADFAPSTFTVELVCTVVVQPEGDVVEAVRETVTLTAGVEFTFEDLPYGATCVLDEGDNGQTSSSGTSAVVGRDDEPIELATLDNVYDEASLAVTKNVEGEEAGVPVDPADAGPFLVFVSCEFMGQPVVADGYDDGDAMFALLSHDEVFELFGLPSGSTCTVTELLIDDVPADTWMDAIDADGERLVNATQVVVTLGPDDPQDPVSPGTSNSVAITNVYGTGALEISKVIDGPGATGDEGPFVFDVECVYQRGLLFPDVVTFDAQVSLGGGGPLSVTLSPILVGSVCTITETDDAGADGWTMSVNGDEINPLVLDPDGNPFVAVEIEDDIEVAEIEAVNTFEQRVPVEITKSIDDAVMNQDGEAPEFGPFTVEMTCVYGEGEAYEEEVYADGYGPDNPMVGQISEGETLVFEGLPSNSVCTVTETNAAGADGTSITVTTPDGSTTTPGDEATFTLPPIDEGEVSASVDIENSWEVGDLTLLKEIEGPGADLLGTGPFTFHVTCVLPQPALPPFLQVWDGDVVLDGEPWTETITGIPVGAQCTVTETETGGADYVDFEPSLGDDPIAVVEIGDEGPVTVTATNWFEAPASLAIAKEVEETVLDEDGDVPDLGPYVFTVVCLYTDPGGDVNEVYADGYGDLGLGLPMIVTIDDGETVVLDGLPATSECTITEVFAGGAGTTEMTVTTDATGAVTTDGTSTKVTLTPEDDAGQSTVLVDALNIFDPGFFVIEKTVSGPDVPAVIGPYTFTVECVLDRSPQPPVTVWEGEVVLGGGGPLSASVDNLVPGAECTVTETDSGGADEVVLTPAGAEDGTAVVTIVAGAGATVTAENVFDANLAVTGFDGWWTVAVAVVLLVVGAILIVVRRRGGN